MGQAAYNQTIRTSELWSGLSAISRPQDIVPMTQPRPLGHVTFDNTDRVVLVTGGCSGIGRAVCDEFLASRARVVCADIDQHAAAAMPSAIAFRRTDVASEADCQEVVHWTVERFGALDVLVNNAAIQPTASYLRIDQLADEMLQQMLAVNFCGYCYMAKHALTVMRRQQSGVVVNMASGQGHRTTRQVPVYGPLKAANLLQAMQWGVEYAREGIRVVSISPGAIDTPMVRANLEV
jgi:NAD(P)-dependent dehydrogenase (short-subunit alcohol dehydrogenase family)